METNAGFKARCVELRLRTLLIGLLAVAVTHSTTQAQTAREFFSGRRVDIVVGTATGTGYDVYARLLARFMPKYIPGEPRIVVRNAPGAGGIVASNQVAVSAPRDGSVLCLPLREAVLDPLFSGKSSAARYDPRELVWIGTPTQEIGMVYVSTASGVKSIEEVMSRQVLVAAGGATSGPAIFPRLLNAVIGTKFKPILGMSERRTRWWRSSAGKPMAV